MPPQLSYIDNFELILIRIIYAKYILPSPCISCLHVLPSPLSLYGNMRKIEECKIDMNENVLSTFMTNYVFRN